MEGVLEVDQEQLESVAADGMELPYVEFRRRTEPAIKLLLDGEEYWYYKTLPMRGFGAALPQLARQLESEGKKILVAYYPPGQGFSTSKHWERMYIYATGVTPLGAGKK